MVRAYLQLEGPDVADMLPQQWIFCDFRVFKAEKGCMQKDDECSASFCSKKIAKN